MAEISFFAKIKDGESQKIHTGWDFGESPISVTPRWIWSEAGFHPACAQLRYAPNFDFLHISPLFGSSGVRGGEKSPSTPSARKSEF